MLKKIKFPQESTKILALLLSTDLFFIFLHLAHKAARIFNTFDTLREEVFSVSVDLGLAEAFQYVKEFWIVLLMVWMVIKMRKTLYLGWVLLFTYLLLDDMLSIHEELGTLITKSLGLDPEYAIIAQFRIQDIGELSVSVFFGGLFILLILFAYLRGDAQLRQNFRTLLGFLLMLVAFGVGVDAFDRLLNAKILKELGKLIEDGGEMIAMSFACWYTYVLTERAATQSNILEETSQV